MSSDQNKDFNETNRKKLLKIFQQRLQFFLSEMSLFKFGEHLPLTNIETINTSHNSLLYDKQIPQLDVRASSRFSGKKSFADKEQKVGLEFRGVVLAQAVER